MKKLKPYQPSVMEQERFVKAVRDAQRLMAPTMAKKYARAGFLWGVGMGVAVGIGLTLMASQAF